MAGNALTYGDSGVGVQALQTSLRGLGYALDVDGAFGEQTKAAVLHFQAAASVTVDGKVGPGTQEAIGRALVTAWKTNDPTPWDGGGAPSVNPEDYTPGIVKVAEQATPWLLYATLAGVAYWLWSSGTLKQFFYPTGRDD